MKVTWFKLEEMASEANRTPTALDNKAYFRAHAMHELPELALASQEKKQKVIFGIRWWTSVKALIANSERLWRYVNVQKHPCVTAKCHLHKPCYSLLLQLRILLELSLNHAKTSLVTEIPLIVLYKVTARRCAIFIHCDCMLRSVKTFALDCVS